MNYLNLQYLQKASIGAVDKIMIILENINTVDLSEIIK